MKRSRMYEVRRLLDCPHAELRAVAGRAGLERLIEVAELNRPSLELTGYFSSFRPQRIQVLGSGEICYIRERLAAEPARMLHHLRTLFSYPMPCVIITNGMQAPAELLDIGDERSIPVLTTPNDTTRLYRRLTEYLEHDYAPTEKVHGVCVEVFGIGILLLGEAGIGKSECALDLVMRGHALICDDLVELRCLSGAALVACAQYDEARQEWMHNMEIRGLGIIDVRRMFGSRSVHSQRRLDLVITLEKWNEAAAYDRTGLDVQYYERLGVSVPMKTIPVRPGRNTATLVEVAAVQENSKRMKSTLVEYANLLIMRNLNASLGG